MKKTLIAMAVAGIAAAPIAAQADAVLYGKVSIDFTDSKTNNSGVERDDSLIGLKGTSETDGGLNITGHLETSDSNTAEWNLAYLAVDNGMAKLWLGKFGSPADAADVGDYSNSGNETYFSGEVESGVGLTWNLGGEGFYAGVASWDGTGISTNAAAAGFDAVTGLVGFGVAGFDAKVGYQKINQAETTGLKLSYSMDALGLHAAYAEAEDAAGADVKDTWKVGGDYTMGATSLKAFYAEDDIAAGNETVDTIALGVSHNLGGGLSAYLEYADNDSNINANDDDTLTIGASFSF